MSRHKIKEMIEALDAQFRNLDYERINADYDRVLEIEKMQEQIVERVEGLRGKLSERV